MSQKIDRLRWEAYLTIMAQGHIYWVAYVSEDIKVNENQKKNSFYIHWQIKLIIENKKNLLYL